MVERMAGVKSGNVILKKIFDFFVLRIVAASSRLESMFLKMPPMRMYANAE